VEATITTPATGSGARRDPHSWTSRAIEWSGNVALVAVIVAWGYVIVRLLSHRVFASHDTMISYAHVWYISQRLWHGHGLPLQMPVLAHGQAFAYPYGFVPWTTAALFRPLLGDWVVTLWLALGAVGTAVATFWAFPELRRHWWAVAVLANPALVAAPLNGQLPFLWASALFLVAIGCWRRERRIAAIVFAALAQITHPAVLMPIVAVLVLACLPWERNRRGLITAYLWSVLFALPAVWFVLRSPVFTDSSVQTKLANFFSTVGPRCLIIAVPVLLAVAKRHLRDWAAPLTVAVLVAANLAMWPPMGIPQAWRWLRHKQDPDAQQFVQTSAFVPGATYRVLLTSNGKHGEYIMLTHGARLDSEFFPESMAINSWPSVRAYSDALLRRHVDYVLDWHSYNRRWKTNEHTMLERLTEVNAQACHDYLVSVRHVVTESRYDLYAVDRSCARSAKSLGMPGA
jgi:hypothetical protein